ncbi:MAG: NAD(P)H-hydrate epimerase [Planctomycetota bacterium]|nr:NAD(P)H-hydrate epimerase [Planctomycetota bacterium]MEA3339949.1 NAD(P)H-hydrate epimerase [Chloroflexota bacterium]
MSYATLSGEQSRRLDRLAMEEFGMTGLVLMENAGRGAVDVLCREVIDGPVLICCGKGNNAGDGFVMARHLDLRGYEARVLVWAGADELQGGLQGDAAENFKILQKTDVPITICGDDFDPTRLDEELARAAWVVDALLGTGAKGEPRAPLDTVIERINAATPPVLAVDLPSGLDCDTGRPAACTIRAKVTCTFAAAKPGLAMPQAEPFVGQVHVLDIGAPRKLIERMLAEQRGNC